MEVVRQRALDCGAVEASSSTPATSSPRSTACRPSRPTRCTWTATRWSRRYRRPLIVKHLVRGRPPARRDDRRARLHRQGQRPGPLRGRLRRRWHPISTCIAPVRDYALTREKAIAFAEENAIPINDTKQNPFSIDQNVWGRAVETGFLEDIWNAPDQGRLRLHRRPDVPAGRRRGHHHASTQGVPVAHRRRRRSRRSQAIEELNRRAGAQGVGRLDVVEDRLVGIKSREIYEAPGAMVLITAHTELEHVTSSASWPGSSGSVGAALGRAGLRRPVVLAAEAVARHVRRRHPGARHRRDPAGAARRPLDGQRPPQRREPVRLQPRHLRRGRHLRPVRGQGLHRDLRPVVQAGRGARRALRQRRRPGRPGRDRTVPDQRAATPTARRPEAARLWGGRFAGGPADALAALRSRRTSTGGWRATTSPARTRTPGCCTAPGLLDDDELAGDARRPRRLDADVASGAFGPRRTTRTCTARSSAGCIERVGPDLGRQAARRPLAQRPGRHAGSACGCATQSRDAGRAACSTWSTRWRPGRRAPGRADARQDAPAARPAGAAGAPPARARPAAAARRRAAASTWTRGPRVSPYGSGALAGSSLGLDPDAIAAELGFDGPVRELHRRHRVARLRRRGRVRRRA